MQTSRQSQLMEWLSTLSPEYGLDVSTMKAASSDASFRRYFRISGSESRTFIIMDAPPRTERIDHFLRVDSLMHEAGLNAPVVYESSEELGFILMSDLGGRTYLQHFEAHPDSILKDAPKLFKDAVAALVKWQSISRPGVLPEYDRQTLEREINLFPEWYVKKHKGVEWTEKERKWWDFTVNTVLTRNLSEPKVFVHRDFMPRNLMVSDPNPGILDFQDALYGPISYDVACLMRDAFISWDESFVLDVSIRYWQAARDAGLPVPEDFGEFYTNIEMMCVQRHLKVLGIFARLAYRDGKPEYLKDAPRFIEYLLKITRRYSHLSPLMHLIEDLENEHSKVGYTF